MKLGLFFILAAHAKPGPETTGAPLQCPEAKPMSCEECADIGKDCVRELDAVQDCKEFKWDPKKNKCPKEDNDQNGDNQGDEDEGGDKPEPSDKPPVKCPQKPKSCKACENADEQCFEDEKFARVCDKLCKDDGSGDNDDDDVKPTGVSPVKCPKKPKSCQACEKADEQCFEDEKFARVCNKLCKDDGSGDNDDDDDVKPTGVSPVKCPKKPKSCQACEKADEQCFEDEKFARVCEKLCKDDGSGDNDDDDVKPTGVSPVKCPKKPKSCKACEKADDKCFEDEKFARVCDKLCKDDGSGDNDDDDVKPTGVSPVKCPKKPKSCQACEKADDKCFEDEKFSRVCDKLCDDDGSGDNDDDDVKPTDVSPVKCPKKPKSCQACEKADDACFADEKFSRVCDKLCNADGSGDNDEDDVKPTGVSPVKCPQKPKSCKACEKADDSCFTNDKFSRICNELCKTDEN